MSRIYSVEFENVSIAAAQDFFEITPASNKPCRFCALELTQISDVADAEEEMLRCRIIRGHTTGGSGGSSPAVVAMDSNDAAGGFTAEANNTTIASAGTAVNIHSFAFNIRVGYQFVWPTEEMRPRVQSTELMVVRLMAAPADAVTMSGTLYVEEL